MQLSCVAMAMIVQICASNIQSQNDTCSICNCLVKDVVDCSNKNLTSIPTDLNSTTKVLDLSSNYLEHIADGNFESLPELIVLDLYNTSLKNVSRNAFRGLSNLKVLNISQNDQFPLTNKSTPPELFEQMPYLEVLRMYGTTGTYNIIYGYPDEQLSKLHYLRELWIDGLTNMTFGSAFANMTSLKVVRLAGDFIKPSWRSKEFCMTDIVNGMFDNFVSVTHLYIRKCDISNIDKDAFKNLKQLEYLDLSDNKKVGLDKMFASFCSLPSTTTTLVLNNVVPRHSTTCGYGLKASMTDCLKDKSVRELHMNNNLIYYVESNVFSAFPKTLQIVSASRNEFFLGVYMFEVFYLTNLTKLDISFQSFTEEVSIWRGNKLGTSFDEVSLTGRSSDCETGDIWEQRNNFWESRHSNYGNYFHDFSNKILARTRTDNQRSSRHPWKVCPQLSDDKYIPSGTVLSNIPPNMLHLDLSHSKLAGPIIELFINENNTLKSINASSSLLYCWDGPIHGLTKLETVDLSNNLCTNVSSRFFQKVSTLKRLNVSFNFLGSVIANDVKGQIMSNLTSLQVLDISFNLIEKIPKLFLKSQKKLTHLYAKFNTIDAFDLDISHMTKLRKLDLKFNRIGTLSERTCDDLEKISQVNRANRTSMKASLFVNLRHNAIECSCNNIRFIKWLYKHYTNNSTLGVNVSECILYDENHKSIPFNSRQNLELMIEKLEYQCRPYAALIIGLSITLAFILNVILGIVVHRFRWKLQYWYYVVFDRRSMRRDDYELLDEPMYKYDVFVASSDDQNEFVIDTLRPALKRHEFAAFIPVYHINFNERLVNIIGNAIHESRAILFVLSDGWSSDRCMNIAVHMWQEDMIDRRKPSVLGIKLNNMNGADAKKIKEIYCKNFIDFPHASDENEQEAFWRDCVQTIRELIDAP